MPGRCTAFYCGVCKPRWMKYVDTVFPRDSASGLVHDRLQKLIYYTQVQPEKLDRIAEYLERKVIYYLSRRRYQFAQLATEIVDRIVLLCRSGAFNHFAESYLRLVHALLESQELQLQLTGTQSFVKFSEIEEVTPNYHRTYDFLLDRFCQMCHSNASDPSIRGRLRVAGLRGIQGIIRKTVADDLQVNIWDETYMNKILACFLFNLQQGCAASNELSAEEDAWNVAKTVFEDLVSRAQFMKLKPIITPVLIHLDNHRLWVPNHFPREVFTIMIESIKLANHCHIVVDMLITHLGSPSVTSASAEVRTSIVQVAGDLVEHAAGEAVGPVVYQTYKNLLLPMRASIEKATAAAAANANSADEAVDESEANFRDEVVATIVKFAKFSPDVTKMEAMKFIISGGGLSAPAVHSDKPEVAHSAAALLSRVLLKTVRMIAEEYTTVKVSDSFPMDFLEPLLHHANEADPGLRIMVQYILQILTDRHANRAALMQVRLVRPSEEGLIGLTRESAARQDLHYMRDPARGGRLLAFLRSQAQDSSNRVDNFEALYTTMALLALEVGEETALVGLFGVGLQLQVFAADSNCHLNIVLRCAVHALVASLVSLLAAIAASVDITKHVEEVLQARQNSARYLLPDVAYRRSNKAADYPKQLILNADCLFQEEALSEGLRAAGYDITYLSTDASQLNRGKNPASRGVWDFEDGFRMRTDLTDLSASGKGELDETEGNGDDFSAGVSLSEFSITQIGGDSANSSPCCQPRDTSHCTNKSQRLAVSGVATMSADQYTVSNEMSFDNMRRIMNEPAEERLRRKLMEQERLRKFYQDADFDEIYRTQRNLSMPRCSKLADVLNFLGTLTSSPEHSDMPATRITTPSGLDHKPLCVNDIDFPSLFIA